jgi:hypothetical protein
MSVSKTIFLLSFFFLFHGGQARGEEYVLAFSDSASYNEFLSSYDQQTVISDSPNPFYRKFFKTDRNGKSKTVAAMLAFPVTGITGIHRVYLGTRAYIPVVYVGTLGGCVGILPLVDFVVLLIDKDISPYENNGKVFMWLK